MNKPPEKKVFDLFELELRWNEQNKELNISESDILSYGAEGLLPIYVEIPNYCKIKVCDLQENIKPAFIKNFYMNDARDNYEKNVNSLICKSGNYSGNFLELLSTSDLYYLLNTKYKFIHLRYMPTKEPNKIIYILNGNYDSHGRLPTIRCEDLRVLREDKQKFEKKHLINDKILTKETESTKNRNERFQNRYIELLKDNKKLSQREAAKLILDEEKAAKRKLFEISYVAKLLNRDKALKSIEGS